MTDINIHSKTLRTRGGMPFKVLADLREYGSTRKYPLFVYYPEGDVVETVNAAGLRFSDAESKHDLIDEPKRVEVERRVLSIGCGLIFVPIDDGNIYPGYTEVGRIVVTIEGQPEHARIAGVRDE